MMSKSGQQKKVEVDFWNKVAKERIYAAFDKEEYEELIDRSIAKDLSSMLVLDVGSASGISAALFASKGAEVYGIDISPDLIEQSKKLWPEYEGKLNFKVGDAENLNFDDQSVDICFFGGVLHHFPEKRNVYREAFRVLKKGGAILAIEPNQLDFIELIEWKIAGLRGKLSPNEYPINPIQMKNDLLKEGFDFVELKYTRNDIPFLAQLPILNNFFNRQKGFWLKRPILRFLNIFRSPECCGTFFILKAVK